MHMVGIWFDTHCLGVRSKDVHEKYFSILCYSSVHNGKYLLLIKRKIVPLSKFKKKCVPFIFRFDRRTNCRSQFILFLSSFSNQFIFWTFEFHRFNCDYLNPNRFVCIRNHLYDYRDQWLRYWQINNNHNRWWCDCISVLFISNWCAVDFIYDTFLHVQHDSKLKMQKSEKETWIIHHNATIQMKYADLSFFFSLYCNLVIKAKSANLRVANYYLC